MDVTWIIIQIFENNGIFWGIFDQNISKTWKILNFGLKCLQEMLTPTTLASTDLFGDLGIQSYFVLKNPQITEQARKAVVGIFGLVLIFFNIYPKRLEII